MCGILGIYKPKSFDDAGLELFDGLSMLQHRGQDSAGIYTFNGQFHPKKGDGLVKEVFSQRSLERLKGFAGIGHVRYVTMGSGGNEDAQPFMVFSPFGIILAHNGNIINYHKLKEELIKQKRWINSGCDAEVILHVFAQELEKFEDITPEAVFESVKNSYGRLKGTYSVIVYIAKKGFVAFRDPYGIRPLIMGERVESGREKSYAFSSESCAFDLLGFDNWYNLKAGEAVFVDNDMKVHKKVVLQKEHTPCIFEFVYFARPDSVMDGALVYDARREMGRELAKIWQAKGIDVDVVVPVPNSGSIGSEGFEEELKISGKSGLVKNIYSLRTFIMPSQQKRIHSARRKLNPIKGVFNGNRVADVDDSNVRGNTARERNKLAWICGAKEVHNLFFSAPVKFPCYYGIDMSTEKELIAANCSSEEAIAAQISASSVTYNTVEGMIRAVQKANPKIKKFCTACFTGEYPTGDVTDDVITALQKDRSGK